MSTSSDYNQIIEDIKKEDLVLMKQLLENDGYFFDEQDGIAISSTGMEKGYRIFDEHLRKNGYNGGTILCRAKFYPNHGAVYALYDSTRFDPEQMIDKLDEWVAKHSD